MTDVKLWLLDNGFKQYLNHFNSVYVINIYSAIKWRLKLG